MPPFALLAVLCCAATVSAPAADPALADFVNETDTATSSATGTPALTLTPRFAPPFVGADRAHHVTAALGPGGLAAVTWWVSLGARHHVALARLDGDLVLDAPWLRPPALAATTHAQVVELDGGWLVGWQDEQLDAVRVAWLPHRGPGGRGQVLLDGPPRTADAGLVDLAPASTDRAVAVWLATEGSAVGEVVARTIDVTTGALSPLERLDASAREAPTAHGTPTAGAALAWVHDAGGRVALRVRRADGPPADWPAEVTVHEADVAASADCLPRRPDVAVTHERVVVAWRCTFRTHEAAAWRVLDADLTPLGPAQAAPVPCARRPVVAADAGRVLLAWEACGGGIGLSLHDIDGGLIDGPLVVAEGAVERPYLDLRGDVGLLGFEEVGTGAARVLEIRFSDAP